MDKGETRAKLLISKNKLSRTPRVLCHVIILLFSDFRVLIRIKGCTVIVRVQCRYSIVEIKVDIMRGIPRISLQSRVVIN